jgi:enoyl-CoA hydratase/carnithine racemase
MLWSNCRIASEKLQFGFPESKYGLFTAFGTTIYLPALIGTENALNLLTQNKLLSSEEAYKLGLINELAQKPSDSLSLAINWILNLPTPMLAITQNKLTN